MTSAYKKSMGEEGSIMVVALLIMAVLSLIGISAATTTEIELQISGNEKFHRIAFHHADSGVFSTPKIISESFDNGAELTGAGINYLGSSGTFYREIMGFDAHDADKDLRITLGGFNVDVDVDRIGEENLVGTSTEFASGAEGVGGGSSGGIAIYYGIDSHGHGPVTSVSNVSGVYRKVVGVAGGL
jgi:hypothetical protein